MNRQVGYYQTRIKSLPNRWSIHYWNGEAWCEMATQHRYYDDSIFEEIGDRVIMPDEREEGELTPVEYSVKQFKMNMQVKNLLYKAVCSPDSRRYFATEAMRTIDTFYNLPVGEIT